MATQFSTTKYPALAFYVGDKRFKFVGGKLVVADEDVDGVKNFVRSNGQYEITVSNDNYVEPKPVVAGVDKDAQSAQKLRDIEAMKMAGPLPVAPAPDAPQVPETDANLVDDANVADANADAPETEADAEAKFNEDEAREYFNLMKNADLRKALEEEGLNVSGNHQELVDRAVAAAAEKFAADHAAEAGADSE